MIDKNSSNYEKYLFVMGSLDRQRKISVIKVLSKDFSKTSTQIKSELKCSFNAANRVLKELEKLELVIYLNPIDRFDKKIILSDLGEKIRNAILDVEDSFKV